MTVRLEPNPPPPLEEGTEVRFARTTSTLTCLRHPLPLAGDGTIWRFAPVACWIPAPPQMTAVSPTYPTSARRRALATRQKVIQSNWTHRFGALHCTRDACLRHAL